jgi:hypothetical protein
VWSAGSLHILEVADPHLPSEVGHFIPKPLHGHKAPQSTTSEWIPKG